MASLKICIERSVLNTYIMSPNSEKASFNLTLSTSALKSPTNMLKLSKNNELYQVNVITYGSCQPCEELAAQ